MTKSNTSHVAEFYAPASVDALNTMLEEKGLSGSQIISVQLIPASSLVAPKREQFRVLYCM